MHSLLILFYDDDIICYIWQYNGDVRIMIGYVSSAGKDKSTYDPEITVIYADDFYDGCDLGPKQVYTYNRISEKFLKVTDTADVYEEISYGQLLGIIELLKLKETESNMAVKIRWANNYRLGPVLLGCEYLDRVWFPYPVITLGCKRPCINITGAIYERPASTLETSFLCDVLNMLFALCEIKISSPFYGLWGSVFISADALRLIYEIYHEEIFFAKEKGDSLEAIRLLLENEKASSHSISDICDFFKNHTYEEREYSGTKHSFAINIKRSCTGKICELIRGSLQGEISFGELVAKLSETVSDHVQRFITLSELFVLTGNLERAGDIRHLTLYELMSAFAFSEKAMKLKSTQNKARARMTHINKTKIPCIIYPDGRCI